MLLDFGIAKGGKEAAHNKRLLERSWDGSTEYVWYDADGNPVGIQRVADNETVVEHNKRAKNDGTRGFSQSREMQKIATIPTDVLALYCAVKGMPYHWAYGGKGQDEAIAMILKDPDFSYLRTDK